MAVQTTSNGQIVPKAQKDNSLAGMLQRMTPELSKALPKHVDPDRMARIALTALRVNPRLNECTPASFLGSVLSAAQLGLEVNTPLGQAYLIPYKSECTLQLGYQGMMDLARRSGLVSSIYAHVVREGDDFHVALGLSQDIHHVPSQDTDRETKPMTHVYAVAKLKDGEAQFVVMTRGQVDAIRKRSRSGGSGPWQTDYEAMAMKTAVRQLFKWIPKSAEMATAAAVDEATEIGAKQSESWESGTVELLEAQGIDVDEPSDTE